MLALLPERFPVLSNLDLSGIDNVPQDVLVSTILGFSHLRSLHLPGFRFSIPISQALSAATALEELMVWSFKCSRHVEEMSATAWTPGADYYKKLRKLTVGYSDSEGNDHLIPFLRNLSAMHGLSHLRLSTVIVPVPDELVSAISTHTQLRCLYLKGLLGSSSVPGNSLHSLIACQALETLDIQIQSSTLEIHDEDVGSLLARVCLHCRF